MVTFSNFEVSGLDYITGDIVHPHSFMHGKEIETGLPQMAGSQELGRWRTTNWMCYLSIIVIYLFICDFDKQ